MILIEERTMEERIPDPVEAIEGGWSDERTVCWMDGDSKKGSIQATFLYIPLAAINVVDSACVNVMSSMIPTTVTEIGLSRVDLLRP